MRANVRYEAVRHRILTNYKHHVLRKRGDRSLRPEHLDQATFGDFGVLPQGDTQLWCFAHADIAQTFVDLYGGAIQ